MGKITPSSIFRLEGAEAVRRTASAVVSSVPAAALMIPYYAEEQKKLQTIIRPEEVGRQTEQKR